jgi:hypothetical protein
MSNRAQRRAAMRRADLDTESQLSPARLAANQANAQLSSGPTSEIGKSISSQNRVSHGLARHNGNFKLLASEDQSAFQNLVAALMEEHQPTSETERLLISALAESHWLRERAQSQQFACLDPETGLIVDAKMSALYLRYETTHSRNFYKSLNQLMKLRADRRKAEVGFEAQNIKTEAHQMKKDTHYWSVLKKDAEVTHQIGLNTKQLLEGIEQNPAFEQAFTAELAKHGLRKGEISVAVAA